MRIFFLSTSTAAMAARLRSEALVDFSAVSIALEDRSYQSGGGICATEDDKIVLMP